MREGERKVILNNVFPKASYMTTMDNLGHETINLFKADEGFFLHLNANGTYSHSKEGAVDVLNLSYVGKGLYQIISKAINCKVVKGAEITRKDSGEKRYNEQKEAIHYAHIPVYKFFKGNITMKGKVEKDLFATFKCDRIVEPKKSIFIAFKESNLLEDTSPYIFKLKETKKFSSACRISNFAECDLEVLNKIISSDVWEDKPVSSFLEKYDELKEKSLDGEENYFSFLGVEKKELQYSNALINILKFKPQFLTDFLEALSNQNCKNNNFDIFREEKSIDLLFRDLDKKNGKIFIIENKIDAGVTLSENGITLDEQVEKWIRKIDDVQGKALLNKEQGELKDDILNLIKSSKGQEASQLSKYYVIAVYWALKAGWSENKIKEDIFCYFLCPEYHRFNYKTKNGRLDINLALSEQYQLTTYKDILNIFDNFPSNGLTDHQKFLLNDFISAISMLAKERDDSMGLKMIRLFIERYEKIKTEA